MATLWASYPSEALARDAAEALHGAGVPGRDVRVITGPRPHDIRQEPAGGFAGPVGPNGQVGSFAGIRLRRNRHTGSFAIESRPHREGSFADTDREEVVSYTDGFRRSRTAGDLRLRHLLRGAALDAAAADRVLDELHLGHAVVLAEVAEIAPGDAQERLEEVAQAS